MPLDPLYLPFSLDIPHVGTAPYLGRAHPMEGPAQTDLRGGERARAAEASKSHGEPELDQPLGRYLLG